MSWYTTPWLVKPKASTLNNSNLTSSSVSSTSSTSTPSTNKSKSKSNITNYNNNNSKSEIWNEVTKQRTSLDNHNNNYNNNNNEDILYVPNNTIEEALKVPYKISPNNNYTNKKNNTPAVYSSASQMNSIPNTSKYLSKSKITNEKSSNIYNDGSLLKTKMKTSAPMKLNKKSDGILEPHQIRKVSLGEQLNSMSKLVNSDDSNPDDVNNGNDYESDTDESSSKQQKQFQNNISSKKYTSQKSKTSSLPQKQQQQQQQKPQPHQQLQQKSNSLTKEVDLSQNAKYLDFQNNDFNDNELDNSDTDVDVDLNESNNNADADINVDIDSNKKKSKESQDNIDSDIRYYSDDESQMLRSLPTRSPYLNVELSGDFETENEESEAMQSLTEGIPLTKNIISKANQYGGNPFLSSKNQNQNLNENRSRKIRSRSPFENPQTIKVSDDSDILQTPDTKRSNQIPNSNKISNNSSPSSISESRFGIDDDLKGKEILSKDDKNKVINNEKSLPPPPPPPPPIPAPFPNPYPLANQQSNIEFDSDLLIDRNEIVLIQKIGEGFFGEVWKGKWNQTQDIAIKKMKHEVTNANDRNTFLSEVFSLSKLRHPNITIFYGVTSPPDALIISELLSGSLFQLIHGYKNDPIPINSPLPLLVILRILRDVASGGSYLHKRKPPIIHRDLSSSNVLLSVSSHTSNEELLRRCEDETRPIAKLTDFGLSRNVDWYMTSCVGNLFYLAPEVFSGDHYTQSADVYSFGILIWELVARISPYASESPQRAAFLAATKGFRPSHGHQDVHTPPSLANLREKCWAANPLERPSFFDVLNQLSEMFESIKSHDEILTNSSSLSSSITNEFNSNTSSEYMDQFSTPSNETTIRIWERRIKNFERLFDKRPLIFDVYDKGILKSLPDPSFMRVERNSNTTPTSISNSDRESGSSLKSQKKSGTHPQNISKRRLVAKDNINK